MLATHGELSIVIETDNWGWRARIGMFIVGVEAVPEAEWWAMCPSGVSVHAARVTAKAPWAEWRGDERQTVTLAEDVERGARQFATMRLSAVVMGHSSSSILGGVGWDEAVLGALRSLLPEPITPTTNGLDCVAALGAIGASRPFLVFPPWFGEALVGSGAQYFTERGLQPAGVMRHDPGRKWRDLPPGDLYAHGMGFEQDVEALHAGIRANCPAAADSVMICGTGFRCVGIIDALETDLGRPVITANQASLWHCLRISGVGTTINGYGQLLRMTATAS